MFQDQVIVVFLVGRAIYTWTDPTGGDNPKTGGTIASFTFRAKQAGKASFSVSGDFYSSDEKNVNPSFSGTSITIQEKTTSGGTTGGSTGGSTGETTGGTTGGSTSGGSSSGTTGGTSTPNTGGTSSGTTSGGSSNTNQGGTTTVSTNANLKELHLNIEGLTPAFNKNTTNYNIVVSDSIDNISINAIPEDTNAKVDITGNTNLKTGLNKITIKVTAPDNKTTKTYTINATKTNNPDLANANLENLAIENVTLNPEFNENILEYNAEVGSTIDMLNILAVPKIQDATVSIQGNDNLQFGENVITITVVAKDGITTRDYVVKVYKKTVEEEQSEIDLINFEEEVIEAEEGKIPVGNIVFMVIILVGIGVIIFILIRKYAKENKR